MTVTVTVMQVMTVTVTMMTVMTVTVRVMKMMTVTVTMIPVNSDLPVLRVVEDVIECFRADIREYSLQPDHPENKGIILTTKAAGMSGGGNYWKYKRVLKLYTSQN